MTKNTEKHVIVKENPDEEIAVLDQIDIVFRPTINPFVFKNKTDTPLNVYFFSDDNYFVNGNSMNSFDLDSGQIAAKGEFVCRPDILEDERAFIKDGASNT